MEGRSGAHRLPLAGRSAVEALAAAQNSKRWAVTLPEEPPKDFIVVLDGKPLVTQFRDMPPEEKGSSTGPPTVPPTGC